ncbi:glycosyltransferase family 1 protein [Alicyclobacillus sp. SO9]|uniref:glycosyltransferase family 4 protein n=1 Tax=Alicyclobacillus sp. SO9 TaxID=2665646 RepID=UPI0018E756AF|nr:glycosyltransferase family 1 protein [Alicyclobacillus sp. SO9]
MGRNFGVVATVVDSDKVTGIEKYVLEFLKNTPESVRSSVTVLAHPGGRDLVLPVCAGMRVLFSPFKNRILTDQLWTPLVLLRLDMDFIYNMTLSYPVLGYGSIPHSIIVHDATPWRFPETVSRGMKLYYRPQLNRALRSRTLRFVATVSKSSKQDIQKYKGITDSRIHVFPLAVDPSLFYPRETRTHLNSLSDAYESRFILAVGTLEPRKNLQRLIEAFSILIEENMEYKLVIVGRKGWMDSLSIPENCREAIVFTGFVSNEELVELYSFAHLFVMPSLYEGFGIPLLEAMSCGVPVLAAATSSLPEVGGDACLYADPLSVTDMARKMSQLLTDETLCRAFRAKGLKRVEEFDWKRSVQKTWDKIVQEVV